MSATSATTAERAGKYLTRRVPLLRGPYPTEEEFDARLRSLGLRPATEEEVRSSRLAQARIRRV